MVDRILLPGEVVHRGREAALEEPGHTLLPAEADIPRTHLAVVVVAARLGILRVHLEVVRRIVQGGEHHTDPEGGRHHAVGSSSHPWYHKMSRWHQESF